MKKPPDLSLVLACYNEEPIFNESVAQIVEALDLGRLRYEIIFVEDKSPDNTAHLIAAALKTYPHTRAIYHQVNCGRGRTVADGIRAARGVVVGYIDIDLEVTPVYVAHMASQILKRRADVVIGKRMYRTTMAGLVREVCSLGYQRVSDWMIGTGGLDTETGYKFFNRRKILPVLAHATHPHWFWDTEIMVYARRAGLKIMEEPVLFIRRTDKTSSVRIVSDTMDYVVHLWKLRRRLG